MIRQTEIKHFQCRYHRNGVAGEGFYLCHFTWDGKAFQAVVFDGAGRCAVISSSPANLCDRWRGDDFETAIRAHIEAFGDAAYSDTLAPYEGYAFNSKGQKVRVTIPND